MSITRIMLFVTLLALFVAPPLPAQDLADYPVRWQHGGGTDFGRLRITGSALIFVGDDGQKKTLPLLYLDEVRIVDGSWVQARSNRETGLSWGLKDVYNFGVVGGKPDAEVIKKVNNLIINSKKARVESARPLDGEKARYMVYKGETIGDDVGLLIITADRVMYRSDTGGKNHEWLYTDLNGVEIPEAGQVNLLTTERAIIKLGLSQRNYRFISHTGAFKKDDIAFVAARIAEAKIK